MDNAGVAPLTTAEAQAFDLNIEQVLEHWPVAYAVREFIANALDEQILSSPTSLRSPRAARASGARWSASADSLGSGTRASATPFVDPEQLTVTERAVFDLT